MDDIDSILMSVYKMGSSIEELSRSLNEMYGRVENLGNIFQEFFKANQKVMLALEKRVSRLEGKVRD